MCLVSDIYFLFRYETEGIILLNGTNLHHLYKTLETTVINYQPHLVIAGFLHHHMNHILHL